MRAPGTSRLSEACRCSSSLRSASLETVTPTVSDSAACVALEAAAGGARHTSERLVPEPNRARKKLGVPCARTRPCAMMATMSPSTSASCMSCVVRTTTASFFAASITRQVARTARGRQWGRANRNQQQRQACRVVRTLQRVHARRRLVEENDLRPLDQRHGELQRALHAAGEAGRGAKIVEARAVHAVQRARDHGAHAAGLALADALQPCNQLEVIARRELGPEHVVLRHHANDALHVGERLAHVEPRDENVAVRRVRLAHQHLEEC